MVTSYIKWSSSIMQARGEWQNNTSPISEHYAVQIKKKKKNPKTKKRQDLQIFTVSVWEGGVTSAIETGFRGFTYCWKCAKSTLFSAPVDLSTKPQSPQWRWQRQPPRGLFQNGNWSRAAGDGSRSRNTLPNIGWVVISTSSKSKRSNAASELANEPISSESGVLQMGKEAGPELDTPSMR